MSNLDRSKYVQPAPTLAPVNQCADNAVEVFTQHAVVNRDNVITTSGICKKCVDCRNKSEHPPPSNRDEEAESQGVNFPLWPGKGIFKSLRLNTFTEPTMIFGIIPQELHRQLLDLKNYQNRTSGVEELKNIVAEFDLKPLPSDSIVDFIGFLRTLLDDCNFKVLYGTLQVINVLIEKLDSNVEKYLKQIVSATLKTLGDTHTISRNEYMNVFRQLMRILGPQKILDLVTGHLKHRNSRVREDVLNIIIAAMLTHPRKDFNVPSLCFEVAPCLADRKKRVRHAALELFAVFDYCLDTGKKQPLMRAVDKVELSCDVEGLMAAVQARRARHVLPRLSSEGLVEYALVIPKPGQRPSSQFGSGADLEWIQGGGRVDSARSNRTDPGSETRLYGYGSLGSLTDNIPLHRRILSAGKNKLPWERSRLPATGKSLPAWPTNSQSCEQISSGGSQCSLSELSQETYIADFESHQPRILGRKDPPSHGGSRKSSGVEMDRPCRESGSPLDADRVAPNSGRSLGRPSSTERTVSLPSSATAPGSLALSTNSTSPGIFLLPSYPLAKLPGSPQTPRLSHRHAESSLSLSSTWPNKRESSPRRREPSPWREIQGDLTSDRCSPLTLRASLVRSSSTSSCRQILSGSRPVPPISPGSQAHHMQDRQCDEEQTSQPCSPPQDQLSDRKLHLDLSQVGTLEQEEGPVDHEEMMNSLRSLRNSAAKKRAKVSLSGSDQDPESPDSAVKLEQALDSPSQTSPSVTSPLSESGLSSLYSPPNSTLNGSKTSSGNMCSMVAKPQATTVSSGKKPAASTDSNSLQDKATGDVSVVGQRVTYSNGPVEPVGDRMREISPPPARPTGRELVRPVKANWGSQANGSRLSPVSDMSVGVIGKGVFGSSTPLPSSSAVATPQEQGEASCRTSGELPEGVYGHAVPSNHHDTDNSPEVEESEDFASQEKVKLSKSARDKMRQRRQEQEMTDQAELQRVENVHRGLRQTVSESSINELDKLRDWQLNGSELVKPQADSPPQDSPSSYTSPRGTQSPLNSFSPHHQPSPPTLPPQSKSTVRRVRRVPSLKKANPSFSNSSADELFPGQRKDEQAQLELRSFSNPDLALTQSFTLLSSNDWEKKIEGMTSISCLAQYHSAVLSTRLPDVCRALIPEVMNLRSGVSRVAVATLGNLYTHLQKGMDQELEGTASALLHKVGVSTTFIRQDVDTALDCMVQSCTPTRVVNALLTGGVRHLNSMVRKCSAQHLADLVEKIGAARLLSGTMDLTERILPAITRLAQDSSQETRYYGRQMLLLLASHPEFDKVVKKYIPAKDLPTLQDLVLTLKTKGLGEMPQDTPSAKGRRSLPGSGTSRTSSSTREPLSLVNRETGQYNHSAQAHNVADRTEYIKQMRMQMGSKDFRERIKAIDSVAAECKANPDMIVACIFPVFDAMKARLQESNSKVNLHALETLKNIIPLLKEKLAQVINLLVPAIADNHLNSKNNAIYSAAICALESLVQNIDNALLLQIFVTKAQLLSGRAKVNLVDKVAELVMQLYPHKPQAVEQKVLPLLWHLLSTSSNSGTILGRGGSVQGATANLCQALYDQMGPRLMDCAASQTHSVTKSLNQLVKTSPPLIAHSERR